MQHVFIICAKGIPAQSGRCDYFVGELTESQQSSGISYHIYQDWLNSAKRLLEYRFCKFQNIWFLVFRRRAGVRGIGE